MTNKDWWKPENLKRTEKRFLANDNVNNLDTGNDFGSYKVMRLTDDPVKSQITSHNELKPRYRVNAIKKILGVKFRRYLLTFATVGSCRQRERERDSLYKICYLPGLKIHIFIDTSINTRELVEKVVVRKLLP